MHSENNFIYRIRIREKDCDNINLSKEDEWHVNDVLWQEKKFTNSERDVLEHESGVNRGMKEISRSKDKYFLFTYVDEDEFIRDEEVTNYNKAILRNVTIVCFHLLLNVASSRFLHIFLFRNY